MNSFTIEMSCDTPTQEIASIALKHVTTLINAADGERHQVRNQMIFDPDVENNIEEMVAFVQETKQPEWIKASFRIVKTRIDRKMKLEDKQSADTVKSHQNYGMF